MLLIKFGKREHLEQLQHGIVHFSALKVFQSDPTSFRGDKMEGRLYIDPKQPLLINGFDISPFIDSCVVSYDATCPEFSFSASILSKRICRKCSDGLYTIDPAYLAEMRQFGECFMLINASAFIDALQAEFSKTRCDYEYHPVVYINKNCYPAIYEYFGNLSPARKRTGHLFLKDDANSYRIQNEWRLVFFDVDHHYPSDNHGVNIKTNFSTKMPVLEAEDLTALRCSQEYLFDD